MRLRPSRYALPVATLVGLLSASGCSAASSRPPVAPATTTPAAGATGRVPSGTVHLTAYTDNDGPTSTVILTGAVGDYGTARSVNPDGSTSAGHDGQLDLSLAHGSFRLDVADLDKRFAAAMAGARVDTSTCSGTATVSGPVPIVAGSGTGSYQGIHGTFTLTITLDEVYQPAGCAETSPYLAQAILITGPGTVAVG